MHVLHAKNLVLMEVQAAHARHVVHTLDLIDAIAFEPDRLNVSVGLQILNRFKP